MKRENAVVVNHFMSSNLENFFELLAIQQSFDINKDQLYVNLIKAQQYIHPDKTITKSNLEKIEAAELSRKINLAYQVLLDDKKRAEHLLCLSGIYVNQEDSNVKPTDELLNEIFKLSEEGIMPEELKLKQQESIDDFREKFLAGKLQEAAQAIIKLQYLNKVKIS